MKKIVRICLALLSFVVLILYIGPLITTGDHSIGVVLGISLSVVLALYCRFFDSVNARLRKIWKHRIGKIVSIILIVVITFSACVGGYAFSKVLQYSKADKNTTEYAILLGCKVNGDKPGVFLRQRVYAGYRYLEQNPSSKIILSGGQGNNEDISEASCMYNELLSMGISPDRMIIEDTSTNTEENFKNSKELMSNNGVDITELTVITNDFHEYRACQFAKKQGINANPYPSKTVWNGYMPFATREVIAIVLQIFFGLHR